MYTADAPRKAGQHQILLFGCVLGRHSRGHLGGIVHVLADTEIESLGSGLREHLAALLRVGALQTHDKRSPRGAPLARPHDALRHHATVDDPAEYVDQDAADARIGCKVKRSKSKQDGMKSFDYKAELEIYESSAAKLIDIRLWIQ